LHLGSNVDMWVTIDSTKLPQPEMELIEEMENPDEENF